MPSFLILQPDITNGPKAGRGARGLNLQVFLNTYFGRHAVQMITLDDLHSGNAFQADHLFIGMPTLLDKDLLGRIRFSHAYMFDYGDTPGATWGSVDQEWLKSITTQYLKPWVEPDWDETFQWGVLPVRRNWNLPFWLTVLRFIPNDLYLTRANRTHDTTFLGNPAILWREDYGNGPENPRIKWLQQIAEHGGYSRSGGLVLRKNLDSETMELLEQPDAASLVYQKGRTGFATYFRQMLNAYTALTPAGNARWSYRHYEAVYAGAIPITSDFRSVRTLIPLPIGGMVHVESGQSVIPALESALKMRHDTPSLPLDNLAYLEEYLRRGAYAKDRPKLLHRFMQQLAVTA